MLTSQIPGGLPSSPTSRHNDLGSERLSMMMLGTAQLLGIRGPTIVFLHSQAQITSNGPVFYIHIVIIYIYICFKRVDAIYDL